MDHWLFEVHILAGPQTVNGCLFMPVIRRRDQDGIDILAVEDLAIVARREEI